MRTDRLGLSFLIFTLAIVTFTSLWPEHARASFLRIASDFDISFDSSGRVLSVLATVTNQGDEPAKDVQVEEVLGHGHSNRVESLAAGTKATFKLESPWVKSGVFGHFPVLLLVHYRDMNGYNFSAPYVTIVKVQLPVTSTPALPFSAPPILKWTADEVSLSLTGDNEMSLKINGPIGIRYHVQSFSSEEVSSRPLQTDFVLDSTGETNVDFRFKNLSAISNSVYPVFAVVTAERGNGEALVSLASVNVRVTQDSQTATAVVVFGFAVLVLSLGRRLFHRV